MKKNIAIICLDKSMSRATAGLLADQLEMRLFDMRELFEFDHKPRLFKDILTAYGATYFRKRESGILGYASDFENIILNLDSDILHKKDTLKKLSDNFLIIYLHLPASKVANIASKEDYSCYKEKSLYDIGKEKLVVRIDRAKTAADIVVNVSGSSYFKVSSDCIRAINRYYCV